MKEHLKKLDQYRLSKKPVYIRMQDGGLLHGRVISLQPKKSSVKILLANDGYETLAVKNILTLKTQLTYQDELDRLGSLVQQRGAAFVQPYQRAVLEKTSAEASISPCLQLRYQEWTMAIRDLRGLVRHCRQYGKQLSDIIR